MFGGLESCRLRHTTRLTGQLVKTRRVAPLRPRADVTLTGSSLFVPLLDVMQRPQRLRSSRSDNSTGEAPLRGSLDATLDRPKLIDLQRPAAQQHPKDGQLAWLARLFIYMEHWKMEYGVTGMGITTRRHGLTRTRTSYQRRLKGDAPLQGGAWAGI